MGFCLGSHGTMTAVAILLMPAPGRFSPVNARGSRDGSQDRPLDELERRDEAGHGSRPPACHGIASALCAVQPGCRWRQAKGQHDGDGGECAPGATSCADHTTQAACTTGSTTGARRSGAGAGTGGAVPTLGCKWLADTRGPGGGARPHCVPTQPGGFAVSDAWSVRGSYDGTRNVRDVYPANEPQSIGPPGSPNAALFQGPARNDFGSIVFALSVVPDRDTHRGPCPVESAVLTETRTGAGSITISCAGGYTARLVARDLAGADVVVDEWSFQVRPKDTDEPSNGPNGMACERREYAVDDTPMDGRFSCGCPGGVAGANCQHSDAKTCSGAGVAQDNGACECNAGHAGADCQRSKAAKPQGSRNSTVARERRATGDIADLRDYRETCVKFSRNHCNRNGDLDTAGFVCNCDQQAEKAWVNDMLRCDPPLPPSKDESNKTNASTSLVLAIFVAAVVVIGGVALLHRNRLRNGGRERFVPDADVAPTPPQQPRERVVINADVVPQRPSHPPATTLCVDPGSGQVASLTVYSAAAGVATHAELAGPALPPGCVLAAVPDVTVAVDGSSVTVTRPQWPRQQPSQRPQRRTQSNI